MNFKPTILFAALILTACGQVQTQEQSTLASTPVDSIYSIENIVGDLYWAKSANHNTLFLVTDGGTILADPLNPAFAEWLKVELAERFDSEVGYVLYSHHHWDHASGGKVFSDTAEFVGHQNFISGLALPMPANYRPLDLNRDGAIQPNEATGGLAADFDIADENGDGNITGAELNRNVYAPNITYAERLSLVLGDAEVQVIYSGLNHSDDGSIVYFPKERVAFAVDFLNFYRLPAGLHGSSIQAWLESIDLMLGLDVEFLLPGHRNMGTKQDLLEYRQYFVDLQEAVSVAVDSGLTLEQTLSSVTMDQYSGWERYETASARNIAEAYRLASED